MASHDERLTFPDEPRADLDRALSDLVDRAQDVLATQGRLRALLRANLAVVEHLELPVVLERIIEAAVELVGSEYGALGVIAPGGGLEQFIHVGIPPEQARIIGHLPEGHGLLGALIDDPRPIRLEHLHDDPRSSGFPAGHPAMESFLGVPIRVRDEVYGNLYLSNQSSGAFSREDEQLVESLAASAGFAIDNARLFAETRRRQAWSAASAEITAAMLSINQSDSLSTIVNRVLVLAESDLVCMILPGPTEGTLVVEVARGQGETELTGRIFPAAGSLAASVLEGKQPRLVGDGGADAQVFAIENALGPMMAVPLISAGRAEGVLLVARVAGGLRFTPADLEMTADFAGQASLAVQLARARASEQRMLLLEDRGRIARDLHDHVIQQLFGTGLELQSVAGSIESPMERERILQAVTNLDAAVTQIRTVIFALSPRQDTRDSVRHRILDLANDLAPGLQKSPTVSFTGPVDLVVTGTLADDVVAVAREALANAAKHANAGQTGVTLDIVDGTIRLVISDNGGGITDTSRRSGLANLEERATARGGSFTVSTGPEGTSVDWSVPIDGSDDGTDAA
ncbi:GAF domain-containing protein [Lacisediminihabitans sp. H27-G8]|uniref:sensor histidine kinase n=1 Tax=Lacisediminihabitans sp. H27-G8 TaxID=3111909 RepID=UPI0038FC0292